MSGRLVVDVATRLDQLRALESAWSELADASGAGPFARPSWCLPWWAVLGRGRLSVITVRDGAELVALAPFHVRRRPVLSSLRFLGHGLGAVSGPLVATGRDDAAARMWKEALSGPRVVDLVECDERADGLDALLHGPWSVSTSPRDVCPVVRPGADFAVFMASRSADLRRILRRAERRLEARDTKHEVEVATTPDAVARVLPDVVRVTDAAEAAKPRQHLLAGEAGVFVRSLLTRAAEAGDLRLFVGRVGGEPAAYALMLRDGRRGPGMAMWLNRHDPAFADVSPGHLLLREMVSHACDSGLEHIDLLIGDARYKRLWADDSYRTLDVTAAKNRAALAVGRHQGDLVAKVRDRLRPKAR